MPSPSDFIVQPVNALGAYMEGQKYQQGQQEGANRNRLLELQQQNAQAQGQSQQQKDSQDREKAASELLNEGVPWADTPEKWAQLQSYAEQRGFPEAKQYGFEAREMLLAQRKPEKPNLLNVAPGGSLVDPRDPSKAVFTQPFKPEPAEKPPVPPSGYTAVPGGLAPIPGGPADPKVVVDKPPPLTAEARLKLAQIEIAERAAREYVRLVTNKQGAFDEVAARMPEAGRILKNAIRAKLRAESGATITEEEVDGEMGRYGPQLTSSAVTNADAAKRLIADLATSRSSLSQSAPDPSADPLGIR